MDSLLPEQDETPDEGTRITEDTIDGVVIGVVFTSDDSSYVVLRAVNHKTDDVFTMVGALAGLTEGQDFCATGKWEKHREYGRQFRVNSFKPVLPSSKEGIVRYLSSGILPGVGEKLAERIVDKFGTDTLNILDNYSQRLKEVSGFGKKKIQSICEAWKTQADQRELNVFMQSLGISAAYCNRILRHFGENAAVVIQNNPYQLTQVRGIGFRLADEVAKRMGIQRTNAFRLASGVEYCVSELTEREGHTCIPKDALLAEAAKVLDVTLEQAEQGLQRALGDGELIAEHDLIYPKALYQAEGILTQKILSVRMDRRNELPARMPVSDTWRMLNEEQRLAVRQAFRWSMSIITGGPGVGKTTVTREIVHVARQLDMKIALAAPTGRAAKRLSESTQEKAQTIHRLLKWEPETGGFYYGDEHKLELDLLIVDEMSMLDLKLASCLFLALPAHARAVFVGDRDQLPSVGPGNVLSDLIESARMPVTQLTQIYRQAEGSRIIDAAYCVNAGKLPNLQQAQSSEKQDFYWIEQEDPDKVVELIEKMITERIPERFGFSPATDIQVLSPMNRGPVGAHALNQHLQAKINPVSFDQPFIEYGQSRFQKGDRVMQVVNNYEAGVFNGDMGTIAEVSRMTKEFTVTFDQGDVSYPFEAIEQLRLSYAITIHKSQGSEFPAVIVPLLNSHFIMLRRNLLYTAMTRAGKLLILIGSRDAVSMAVRNYKVRPRYTQLGIRLKR